MAGVDSYNQFATDYDLWFESNQVNQAAYQSELAAVQSLLPAGEGVEIGAFVVIKASSPAA